MTTAEEFRTYLETAEAERIEFKEARNKFSFDDLVSYCVALANEGGGTMLLGVTNRRPRTVVGTSAFPEPGETAASIYQRLHRRVAIEEYQHQGHRVLIVHVPSRAQGSAWDDGGRFLMRAGDALVGMTAEQLQRILAETGPDFSAEVCVAGTMTDLDPQATAEFRRLWARKEASDRIAGWSGAETLAAAELVNGERVTYAALLLLGTPEALGRHLAPAEIVFEYRSQEAAGPAQDRVEYREGFLLFHDRLWERINRRNDRQSYQDGFFRYDIPTFDEAAIREAALNAWCHRDYRSGGSVFVRQFPDRVEVISPGGFPPGVTAENVLDAQNPRNRRLAEALARCGLIERAGQGMNLMFERAVRQSKPLPDLSGTSATEVRLLLRGTVTNRGFLRFMERVGESTLSTFDTKDMLILDLLQREEAIPEALRPRIGRLVAAGVVESIGRGRGTRYLLSRRLYAAIGQKGVYTRRRGLDREQNKTLLLRHLRDSAAGAPMAELQQVLPAQSRGQLKGLLRELRAEGHVRVAGSRRAARWVAV